MNKYDKTKAIQKKLNIKQDGSLGPHTIDSMYRGFADAKFPYKARFYGHDVMLTSLDRVNPFDPGVKPLRNFAHCISGSFSWELPDGSWGPISILISNGRIIRNQSCHYHDLKKPESVLWFKNNGHFGVSRVCKTNELPLDIKWAVGGLGLKKNNDRNYYDNVAEGFNGRFGDVLRRTSHMVIGVDANKTFIAILVKNLGIVAIRKLVDNMGLTDAVMLDGGHLTGANFEDLKYNVNTNQRYAIQL